MSRKQAYEQQQRAKLKEWQAEIDKLQAKAGQATADAKVEIGKQMDALRSKREAAESKLEELGRAGEEKWEEMKAGIEGAFKDLWATASRRPRLTSSEPARDKESSMTTSVKDTLPAALVASSLLAIAVAVTAPPALASDAGSGKETAASADLRDVKREWAQASRTLMAYTVAQRDQALDEGRRMLTAMDQRIEKLEARAADEWGELSDAARGQREQTLRALRKQRNEVAEWYGGLSQSSASAWNKVKKGFVDAYGELNSAFGEAVRAFERSDAAKKSPPSSG